VGLYGVIAVPLGVERVHPPVDDQLLQLLAACMALLRLVLLCLQESAEPPVVPAPGHLVGTDLPDLGTGYGGAAVGGWGSLVLILVHNKSFPEEGLS